jgi:hypothetical protein
MLLEAVYHINSPNTDFRSYPHDVTRVVRRHQQGPLYPFAKQPLNLKFANADRDLTKIFVNCKFYTLHSSFQDILNNHTFSVRKCVRRNAREEMQAPS